MLETPVKQGGGAGGCFMWTLLSLGFACLLPSGLTMQGKYFIMLLGLEAAPHACG